MFFLVFLLRFAGFPEFGSRVFVFYTFFVSLVQADLRVFGRRILKCCYLTSK